MEPTRAADRPGFKWFDIIRALWLFLEGRRASYVFWTVVLFVVYFYQMVPALIIARIIDFFSKYHAGQPLTEFYIWAIVLGFGTGIVGIIRLTGKNKLGDLQTHARYLMRTTGFERLVDFSVKWHDKENTGNKVQRIQRGDQAMADIQQLIQSDLFLVVTSFIGVLIAFFYLDYVFVIFMVIYLIGFFGIQSFFYKKLVLLQNERNKLNEQASGSFFEGVNNIMTIKTLGAQDTFKTNIFNREEKSRDLTIFMRKTGINKWKAFQVFNAIGTTIYILLVGRGLLAGTVTIGAIYIYGAYLTKLVDAAASSTDVFDELIDYRSAFARMMPIFWETIPKTDGTALFPDNWNSIVVNDGVFAYPASDPEKKPTAKGRFALRLGNFEITRNCHLGVVGHSGSGKSTLAKILLGIYQLRSGEFTVDGLPYQNIRHDEVTRAMTIVLQDSEMFNLSLKDNITLMRSVTPELFEKAIRISQLAEVVAKLPNGLDTLIGEKGYRLSGGERQRVGIARAICKNSGIMVLDEATSSLDSKTEQLIQEGIDHELADKTLIVIAHRLSTLKNSDVIYVFDHGTIIETGSYLELLNNPTSHFYSIYEAQRLALTEDKKQKEA
ncbi:MAG: ABC transporter ATP-binding protein [Patescibacteria group bacterium]|jgi:ABC-type multidrug transport system fused ATPase/permease subunit